MCKLFFSACRVHLNAGNFDLDNQFFLELATSEEWVSTKVILVSNFISIRTTS